MMAPWVIIVVVIDDNDAMIDLANVDPNINEEEKDEIE